MDPITTMVLGTAINQYMIHSKKKESYRLAVASAAKIAEAQVKAERCERQTKDELNKLFTRIEGIVCYIDGTFFNVFKPFESLDNSLQKTLMEDLLNADAVSNLKLINSLSVKISQRPKIEQNSISTSGITTGAAYILFGNLGVASKQLDAARIQSQKAELIATHIDTFCIALDLQREQYARVNQTLGALNVALIVSTSQAKKGMDKISWMLDDMGHLPMNVTARELKSYLQKEDLDSLAICINIARCIYAILSEPLFGEDSELTQRAQKLLEDGESALNRIKNIESGRK